jgi:hypothetical protein
MSNQQNVALFITRPHTEDISPRRNTPLGVPVELEVIFSDFFKSEVLAIAQSAPQLNSR